MSLKLRVSTYIVERHVQMIVKKCVYMSACSNVALKFKILTKNLNQIEITGLINFKFSL